MHTFNTSKTSNLFRPEGEEIVLPDGEYAVTSEEGLGVIDAATSYVTRFEGNMQSKWTLESGSVSIKRNEDGMYGANEIKMLRLLYTADLKVVKRVKLEKELKDKVVSFVRMVDKTR